MGGGGDGEKVRTGWGDRGEGGCEVREEDVEGS